MQRLERVGYAARLPKQEDRRKSLIILTEKGAAIVRENPQILHRTLLLRLQQLDDEEYNRLQSAFKEIISFLDVEEMDAAPIVTSEANIPVGRSSDAS